MNYRRTRYVGGPTLDTPTTAQRADALRERMAQLRGEVFHTPAVETAEMRPETWTHAIPIEPKHDDIHNPYDFDDSERY